MAAPLARGTRIGRPRADGSLIPGTILGPAFGDGFYRAELMAEGGPRIVCLHVGEFVVEPVFADLRTAAVAMWALDVRTAPARPARRTGVRTF
ncbi:hypothetical protein MKK75_03170 [Methylobacterium sp. J-030]|uniref:hypothetical protein n=1 Tax=Methylobacterium sp. J-030 TaxID=2836627 RepID=UPI001FBAEDE9|nr:hypothetical protein [Methylobacterium sp. J-030]MCJ2067817.1 hypothetical protein [Methylobacterium sp. J-030]